SPPSTASTPRFEGGTTSLYGRSLTEVWVSIAQLERSWRPHSDPLAVIVHLDEVQLLESGDEGKAAQELGRMVRELAEQVWDQHQPVALFPIFYVSGLSKTLVLRTASASPPIPVSLPLLTAEHYTNILRRLFGLGELWKPPAPLARALRCIEGPPRLLLTFLWAVQASGMPDADTMFGTEMDCQLLPASLNSFSWSQSVAVLNRCLGALDNARLVTFTHNIKQGSECLELFHNIAALVLLSQPVALNASLDGNITVNQAIAAGFALAQPIEGKQDMCRLHWPRIYIWALAKVRVLPNLAQCLLLAHYHRTVVRVEHRWHAYSSTRCFDHPNTPHELGGGLALQRGR
ncbi:MAG: hypothetical protein ACOY5G_12930, partial [Pseudomonadota bacterium]